MKNRTSHRAYRRKRQRLKQHQDLVCAWCGQPIDTTLPWTDPMAFQADHETPVSKGGHNLGPLQPMHRRCNAQRGNKPMDQHRRHVRDW